MRKKEKEMKENKHHDFLRGKWQAKVKNRDKAATWLHKIGLCAAAARCRMRPMTAPSICAAAAGARGLSITGFFFVKVTFNAACSSMMNQSQITTPFVLAFGGLARPCMHARGYEWLSYAQLKGCMPA